MAFERLRQAAQAMSPANIKRGIELSRQSIANGGRLTEEQMAGWTPEQRAQYEAQVEEARRQQAAVADRIIEAERARRVLFGPAGDHLYGPLPDRERLTDLDLHNQLQASRFELRVALGNPFGRKAAPSPPTPPVSGDREAQYAHERAQRAEARTPYLAPQRWPVVMTRLALDRKRFVQDLANWLGQAGLSARPDLVYGIYRVPDHIVGSWGIGRAAVVEWEVVHAAAPGMPPAPPAFGAVFDARVRWAARLAGEPSIVDEDLGLDYLRAADVGPEQCLGIARIPVADASTGSSEDGTDPYVVIGVGSQVVLHPSHLGAGIAAQMERQRPLQVLPAPGVHVEVLNWSDVRRVVAPQPDKRFLVPSPFPYLPSTGAELLESYLAVVGVRPSDCYSAQVTLDQPSDIRGGSAGFFSTGSAEPEMCADGKVRKRYRGGSRIVVVYRDSPDYVAGRERWAAYEREVLQASLSNRITLRDPIAQQSALDKGVLRAVLRGAETVGSMVDGDWQGEPLPDLPYYRYCWPPLQ